MRAVERTIGVVRRERLLMSPTIANVPKLADERAFPLTEHLTEYAVPLVPHGLQEELHIACRCLLRHTPGATVVPLDLVDPARPVLSLAFALYEGLEARTKKCERSPDPFMIGTRHEG